MFFDLPFTLIEYRTFPEARFVLVLFAFLIICLNP